MMSIINELFPFSPGWSWGTFILYVLIGIFVSQLCYKGACLDAKPLKNIGYYRINGYYVTAFVILVLLATLRSENVGPDTKIYIGYFQNATSFSIDWGRLITLKETEPGFMFYLYILRKFTDNYTIYFLVTYSWIAGAYIFFIKNTFNEQADYTFLQIFIYYYTGNMSGARSALGVAFVLISLVYLNRNRYVRAIIFNLVACLFHYTMVYNFLIILVVWLYRNKEFLKNRRIWLIGLSCSMILSVFSPYIFKIIFAGTKYASYLSGEKSFLGSIFLVFFWLLCFLYYKEITKSENFARIEVPFISSLLLLVLYPFIFVLGAYRIPNYYALPRLAVWSEMVKIDRRRSKLNYRQDFIYKLVLQIVIILYLLFLFTRSAVNGSFAYEFVF